MAVDEGKLIGRTFRLDHVKYDYPPPPCYEWTKKEIDDELRDNGIKVDVSMRGMSVLQLMGFKMELSPKVSRGQFVISEKFAEPNGQMIRGLVDFIAEGIGSASGELASETRRVVGIELNRSYLQPAYVGQELTVVAKPLMNGSSIQVWEMKFETEKMDSENETVLIAVARLTLMVQPSEAMDKLATRSKL